MGRGAAIPKGRIQFPRQPKENKKDRILVFAEGRQAEEARRAGAEFVGGTELIDGVGLTSVLDAIVLSNNCTLGCERQVSCNDISLYPGFAPRYCT